MSDRIPSRRSVNDLARQIARRAKAPDEYRELTEAMKSLMDAQDGDTDKLRERLRKGVETVEERQLAADLVPPTKILRSIGRPEHGEVKQEAVRRFLMEWLKAREAPDKSAFDPEFNLGWTVDNVTKQVQKHYGKGDLSRSAVYDLMGEVEREKRLRRYCIHGRRVFPRDQARLAHNR
jgi:hypothetical protein